MSPKRKSRGKYRPRLSKGELVVKHDAQLPDVCLKCGTHGSITKRQTTFYWIPMWTRALVFCGVGLLLMLLLREEAALAVPLCPSCLVRWNRARHARLAAIVIVVGTILAMRFWLKTPRDTVAFVAIPLVMAGVLVIVLCRPWLLQVKRIDIVDDVHLLHLKGFHTAAAQEIVDGAK